MTRRNNHPSVPGLARALSSDTRPPSAVTDPPPTSRAKTRLQTTAGLHLIPEAMWQRTVIECLRARGWAVFHDRVAWRSDPGYPDLTAVHHRHGAAWIELKTERGKLTAAQEVWRDTLIRAGQRHYVWRPSDWLEVVAVAGGAVPGATQRRERSE